MFDADEANATYRPSAEIDGSADALFGKPPPAVCDTSVVRPGGRGQRAPRAASAGRPAGDDGRCDAGGDDRQRGPRRRDQRQAQRDGGHPAGPGAQGRRYPE